MLQLLGMYRDGGDNAENMLIGVFENQATLDRWIETHTYSNGDLN